MNQTIKRVADHRYSRFATVGVFNTLLDFALLNFLLATIGNSASKASVVVFNTISATCVAFLSFFLNKRFVFKADHTPRHYAVYFIIITLCGLYIVQNGIIYIILHWFSGGAKIAEDLLRQIGISGISHNFILINSAKAVATIGSMLWNYLWYKRVIFREVSGKG